MANVQGTVGTILLVVQTAGIAERVLAIRGPTPKGSLSDLAIEADELAVALGARRVGGGALGRLGAERSLGKSGRSHGALVIRRGRGRRRVRG